MKTQLEETGDVQFAVPRTFPGLPCWHSPCVLHLKDHCSSLLVQSPLFLKGQLSSNYLHTAVLVPSKVEAAASSSIRWNFVPFIRHVTVPRLLPPTWPFVYILVPLLEETILVGYDSVLFTLVLPKAYNQSIRASFLLIVGIQHMFVEWGTQRHCKRWNPRYSGPRAPCFQLRWTRSEGSLSSKANAGPIPEGIYPFLASASKFPLSPSRSPLDLSLFAH